MGYCVNSIGRNAAAPHTVKYQLKMSLEEHVSWKNIFWSALIDKSWERKENDFSHCPFELQANQYSQSSPDGPNLLC